MKELLGKRIKELRTQKRLTQEQLAEMVDMGERNLSKIECGVNFVSAETLEKITNALGVTAKDIFDFDHVKDKSILKTELLNAINQDEVDVDLLYRIYQSIKKLYYENLVQITSLLIDKFYIADPRQFYLHL